MKERQRLIETIEADIALKRKARERTIATLQGNIGERLETALQGVVPPDRIQIEMAGVEPFLEGVLLDADTVQMSGVVSKIFHIYAQNPEITEVEEVLEKIPQAYAAGFTV